MLDGVVIVGRVGRNRRDVAQRLHETLAGAGAPLLGVIANGFKSGRRGSLPVLYAYDYSYIPDKQPAAAPAAGGARLAQRRCFPAAKGRRPRGRLVPRRRHEPRSGGRSVLAVGGRPHWRGVLSRTHERWRDHELPYRSRRLALFFSGFYGFHRNHPLQTSMART